MATRMQGIEVRPAAGPNQPRARVGARKIRLAWLTMVGFVLGVTLCPFNPADRRNNAPESRKENKMELLSTQATVAGESLRNEASTVAGIETATFAMG